jgi:8-oxo-dGTP pyrophosphatase MutT (NUDIX family)
MILLVQQECGWCLPLTIRPEEMKEHGGQICLPGGAVDPGEDPTQTALRELHEELGIEPQSVEVLGHLSETFLFVSNYLVTPCVGVCRKAVAIRPDPREVHDLLYLPVSDLCNPVNHRDVTVYNGQAIRGGLRQAARPPGIWTTAPAICWNDFMIWGATAIVLGEFVAILEGVTNLVHEMSTSVKN